MTEDIRKARGLPNLDLLWRNSSAYSHISDGNVPEQSEEVRELSGPAKPFERCSAGEIKTRLRRERNKFAARDSRKKKQDKSEALWKECLQLESEGTEIRAEVMELNKQKEHLHKNLDTHLVECPLVRPTSFNQDHISASSSADGHVGSENRTGQYSSTV